MPNDAGLLLSIMLGQFALVAGMALALAWLSERLGGSRLLGGLLAGLLLSAAVAGQWLPGVYQRVFTGGYHEQLALAEKHAEREELREVLAFTGVTNVALVEFDQMTEQEVAPLQEAITAARAAYAQAGALMMGWLLLMWLAVAGAATGVGRLYGHVRDAMPIAIGCLVVVAFLATVGATLLGRMTDGAEANRWFAGLLIVCMVGAVPLSHWWVARLKSVTDEVGGSQDDAGGVTETVALLLSLIAVVMLTLIAPAEGSDPATMAVNPRDAGWTLALIVVGLFVIHPLLARYAGDLVRVMVFVAMFSCGYFVMGLAGAVVALVAGLSCGPVASGRATAIAPKVLGLLTPITAATLAMQVTLADWSWWLLLVVLIASYDGKAIGMWVLGKLFAGRAWDESLKMGVALSSTGLLPVVLAYVLLGRGVVDPSLFAAVVLATIVMEMVGRPIFIMVSQSQGEDPSPTI